MLPVCGERCGSPCPAERPTELCRCASPATCRRRRRRCLQSFYYDGKPAMSNEEFDLLKDELLWSGSKVAVLRCVWARA